MSNDFKDFTDKKIRIPSNVYNDLKKIFPDIKQELDQNELLNYKLLYIALCGEAKHSLKAIELSKKLRGELAVAENDVPKRIFAVIDKKQIDYEKDKICQEVDDIINKKI